MPIAYYGSRISPHMTKTDEGYLICHDVPINRIGLQEYMGDELGMHDDKAYKVLREPGEVFSPAALASFNGKPITDGHPPDAVNTDNIQFYEKGHAQNIRKGTGLNSGTTIADLFITDPQLIHEIEDGKREISCGYTYDLFPHKNGTFEQRRIRGNHIAVVDEGRAGHRVAIKDEKPKLTERGKTMVKEKSSGLLGRILKLAAKDENMDPEDLEKLSKMKEPDAEDEIPEKSEPEKDPEKAEAAHDEDPATVELLKKVIDMLGELKESLAPKESEDELEDLIDPEHEASESPEEEAEERAMGKEDEDESPEEQEPSVTIPAEEITEKVQKPAAMDEAKRAASITRDALRKAIKDPKAYKMAAKDAATEIRKQYGISKDNSGYSRFISATSAAAKVRSARDAASNQQKMFDSVQSAYDNMNPHNKEAK